MCVVVVLVFVGVFYGWCYWFDGFVGWVVCCFGGVFCVDVWVGVVVCVVQVGWDFVGWCVIYWVGQLGCYWFGWV